jgi:hypothetical protein
VILVGSCLGHHVLQFQSCVKAKAEYLKFELDHCLLSMMSGVLCW